MVRESGVRNDLNVSEKLEGYSCHLLRCRQLQEKEEAYRVKDVKLKTSMSHPRGDGQQALLTGCESWEFKAKIWTEDRN